MKILSSTLLALCVALSTHAADKVESSEPLKAFIVDYIGKNAGAKLPVRMAPGQVVQANVEKADAQGIQAKSSSGMLDLSWKMLGEEGVFELVRPLMQDAPVKINVAFLEGCLQRNKADDPGFKKVLERLWEKDASEAKRIEEQLKKEPANAPASADAKVAAPKPSQSSKSASAYLTELGGSDAVSVSKWLGPDYDSFHKGGKPEEFPTLPGTTDKHSGKIGMNGKGFVYQFGEPNTDPGGYWTTQGQILYVPDKANDYGVDRLDLAMFGHDCLQFKPAPAWWGGTHPEPAVLQKSWAEAAGGPLGQPFAIERGHWSFSENGFMLFKSGLLGAGAVNNIYSYPCFMFPKGKVPTAVAVSHKGEFIFVTVCDTQANKGQLAVLASCNISQDAADKSGKKIWALPSWGVSSQLKLLGYVDLPGVVAPSEVSVCGNNTAILTPTSFNEFDLTKDATREKFYKGSEKGQILSAGCAVVMSKAEGKIAFVDLRPLYSYYREMYFTTPENLAKTRDLGPEPKKWPFAFEAEPLCKPHFISTLDVPEPTALRVTPFSHDNHPALAVVGCMDGRLFAYDLSSFTNPSPKGDAPEAKPFARQSGPQSNVYRPAALRRPLPQIDARFGCGWLVQHVLHGARDMPG